MAERRRRPDLNERFSLHPLSGEDVLARVLGGSQEDEGFTVAAEEEVEASVGIPIEPEYLRPTYANHMLVNFTPWDFRLTFNLLQVPLEKPPEVAPGTVEVRPTAVASIIIPATLMHALLTTLQTQFENYLGKFGPPGMNPEGPGGGST